MDGRERCTSLVLNKNLCLLTFRLILFNNTEFKKSNLNKLMFPMYNQLMFIILTKAVLIGSKNSTLLTKFHVYR